MLGFLVVPLALPHLPFFASVKQIESSRQSYADLAISSMAWQQCANVIVNETDYKKTPLPTLEPKRHQ
jgi:hypothetical protein